MLKKDSALLVSFNRTICAFLLLAGSFCQAMEKEVVRVEAAQPTEEAKNLIQQLLSEKYEIMKRHLNELPQHSKDRVKTIVDKSHSFSSHYNVAMTEITYCHAKEGYRSAVISTLSPHGRIVLTADKEKIRLWDTTKTPLTFVAEKENLDDDITAIALNDHVALTGTEDGTIRLWEFTKTPIESRRLTKNGQEYDDKCDPAKDLFEKESIIAISLSADGESALIGTKAEYWYRREDDSPSRDMTVRKIYLLSNLKRIPKKKSLLKEDDLPCETQPRQLPFALSANGRLALSKGEHDFYEIRLFDPETGEIHGLYEPLGCDITSVALSTDYALIECDGDAYLLDIRQKPNHEREDEIKIYDRDAMLPHDGVTAVALSADGRIALTGSSDKTIHLWDLTKSPITSQVLLGHSGDVESIVLSSDGHTALSASAIETIVWKIQPQSLSLPLDDLILILNLQTNPDFLLDDPAAIKRLEILVQSLEQHPKIIEDIQAFLYRKKLPDPDCLTCEESYHPKNRICLKLPCCKNKHMCKECLERVGNMICVNESEKEYQLQDRPPITARCPFCTKPAAQMGIIKPLKIDDKSGSLSM